MSYMGIDKKNLVYLVKFLSLSSIIFCGGCEIAPKELFTSKGPYEGVGYKKPEGSIIFDYEKKVGPLPASRPSIIKPQPYRENLQEGRRKYYRE